MGVPAKYARCVTEDEWRALALGSYSEGARTAIEAALGGLARTEFGSEEERRRALTLVFEYARMFGGPADLGTFTAEETRAARELAERTLDELRDEGGGANPWPPGGSSGAPPR